jgi:lipoprotein-anchoring transpeptidase ErfK/SrfK
MRRHPNLLRPLACALALLLAAPAVLAKVDAPPARIAAQAPIAPDSLKPGEFQWEPGWEVKSNSPLLVVVNLAEQRGYVYRDGRRIGTTTVSTGKPGHETPTGTFAILQKKKLHHSNLYKNERTGQAAPMPWMQRLSWQGVALHEGRVRAQPASHGCVRLPAEFARQLYTITRTGDAVVIARDGSVEGLSLAGLSGPLSALIRSADTLRALTSNLVAEESAAAPASAARGTALQP